MLEKAQPDLATEEIVSIDVEVGDGAEGVTARLIVPRRFAHVAYAGQKLFKPGVTDNPTYQVVMFFDEEFEQNKSKPLPKKDITIRLAHAADGRMVKFVRNSNYFGEWKKGVFAGEDYRAKLDGNAIFLHAGCRKDTLENRPRPVHDQLFAVRRPERQRQDQHHLQGAGPQGPRAILADPGRRRHALPRRHVSRLRGRRRCSSRPTALNPGEQIEAYYACLKRQTFLENVYVERRRQLDFYNLDLHQQRPGGRSSAATSCTPATSINAQRVDNLFLITRGSIIPAVGQADATSRRRPSWCWGSRWSRRPATRPRRARSRTSSSTIRSSPATAPSTPTCSTTSSRATPTSTATCSTPAGSAKGMHFRDINLGDTMGILDSVLRGGLEDWMLSEGTGLLVPRAVRAVDSILMHPDKLYGMAEFEKRQKVLDRQRAEFISSYPGLHPDIVAVFQP